MLVLHICFVTDPFQMTQIPASQFEFKLAQIATKARFLGNRGHVTGCFEIANAARAKLRETGFKLMQQWESFRSHQCLDLHIGGGPLVHRHTQEIRVLTVRIRLNCDEYY